MKYSCSRPSRISVGHDHESYVHYGVPADRRNVRYLGISGVTRIDGMLGVRGLEIVGNYGGVGKDRRRFFLNFVNYCRDSIER